METTGPESEVVTMMPPLTVTDDEVEEGIRIISDSVRSVCG